MELPFPFPFFSVVSAISVISVYFFSDNALHYRYGGLLT
jgi:hypothetical protein